MQVQAAQHEAVLHQAAAHGPLSARQEVQVRIIIIIIIVINIIICRVQMVPGGQDQGGHIRGVSPQRSGHVPVPAQEPLQHQVSRGFHDDMQIFFGRQPKTRNMTYYTTNNTLTTNVSSTVNGETVPLTSFSKNSIRQERI